MFRSIALCALLLGFSVQTLKAEPIADPQADFEAFWSLYDEKYALFEVKRVDWNAVYKVYRPRVTQDTNRDELFDIFEEATDLLNDVHVTVEDHHSGLMARSGGRSLGTGPFDIGIFSVDLIAEGYSEHGLQSRAGNTIRFGWLPNDMGYIHINAFKYPTTTEAALAEIIETLSDAEAIVIDVRQNGGGFDKVARIIASRFTAQRVNIMTLEERISGGDHSNLTAPVQWALEPAGSHMFEGKVIVLTNSRTISAAENFVTAMRTLPNVTIMGETTAGAMADTIRVPVGDGWIFGVPINLIRDKDGKSWEGIGIVPDLWVTNTPEDIAVGRDAVLEMALAFAPHI